MMISMLNACWGVIPSHVYAYGTLLRLFVFFFLTIPVECVCPHCSDTIPGCTGGDNCLLVKGPLSNAQVFAAGKMGKVPSLQGLVEPFLLQVFTRPS